tara:strand:- start:3548 stop:4057 length:510 start_codon:yes stop_codon:yes gene_type:complete
MENEDYRGMVLNNTTMKVFRDGRIHTFHNRRKTWTDRKFRTRLDGYYDFGTGSHNVGTHQNHTVHCVIALCYLGEKPDGYQVDHINNIPTDNRLENLQYLPKIDNDRKRIDHKRGQPIKGYNVTKYGKCRAIIGHYGKKIDLGSYDTKEEARQAYVEAKLKYHGVVINF